MLMQAWAVYCEPPTAAKRRRAAWSCRVSPSSVPSPRCSRPSTQGRRLAARAEMGWLSLAGHQRRQQGTPDSRHGADYTDRLPGMAEALGKLPTQDDSL
jgi:hypothetical protein